MTCDLNTTQVIIRAHQIYGVIIQIFFGLGIAGSIFNLATLFSDVKFTSRLYTYLKALSVYDLGFLLFAFLVEADKIITILNSNRIYIWCRYFVGLPISNGFRSASVYVVVCMTIDRSDFLSCFSKNTSKSANFLEYKNTHVFTRYFLKKKVSF